LLFSGQVNGRHTAMTRLVGIGYGGAAVAVLLKTLRRRRVIDLMIAGQPVIVWWQRGTASALSSASIAPGSDVGATRALRPVVHGRRLHFLPVAGGFSVTGRPAAVGPFSSPLTLAVERPLNQSRSRSVIRQGRPCHRPARIDAPALPGS
jgi:hypothetical protein